MIYITGDCHGDFSKLSPMQFPDQSKMTKDDIVIICGDFGGIWNGGTLEDEWLNWLSVRPFTTVFVDGNHENFDRLYGDEFETVDFHGGKAHMIRNNIYHLIRGYVFDFGGKKFFVFGGASSQDIRDGIIRREDYACDDDYFNDIAEKYRLGAMFRIDHVTWWSQEMPSDEEMSRGLKSLSDNGNSVDYVITHCAPQTIASVVSRGFYKLDKLTSYFDKILENLQFKRWYFGHYHDNTTIWGKFVMIYDNIERIE